MSSIANDLEPAVKQKYIIILRVHTYITPQVMDAKNKRELLAVQIPWK